MMHFFVVLVFITMTLFGLSNNEMLNRANAYIKIDTKSNQFRAYNEFKNLYLRSIIHDDERLKKSALKGIIGSGKKLHIDVMQYEKEYATFNKKSSYHKLKPNKVLKKAQQIKIKSLHKLKNISWYNNKLILKFDKKLRKNQINYFTLYDKKKKSYKYVFDIHASMLSKSQILRKAGIQRIKIAQYKPNTLRLVIQNNKKVKIRFNRNMKILTIGMTTQSKKRKPKRIYTPLIKDKKKIIVIDAGHGGKDPGAIGYKRYREKVVVLKIAQYLKNILKYRGYKVYMTRDSDEFIKLSNRTALANRKSANLFISIHANAVPKRNAKKAYGVECYFLSPSRSDRAEKVAEQENTADISEMNKYSKHSLFKFLNHAKTIASHKLAIDLQRGMLGSLNAHYKGVNDGGVREGPFWVLVGAQMPAVLVEVGFITNPKEAKRLVSNSYRKRMAMGLADGIQRYFENN